MHRYSFLFFMVFFINNIKGQTNIGIGTYTPHVSAALEIQDTSRGILIPRMTMAQRNTIQNPAEGLMVYQTDSTKGFWYYSGLLWNKLTSNNSTESNLIVVDSNSNYTIVKGISIPNFLNFFGDGSLGNHTCINNETINTNSNYKNLIIPFGLTVRINPSVTTFIYVKDTFFLNGTIDGKGGNFSSNGMNATSNHLGAASSGYYHYSYNVSTIGGDPLFFGWTSSNQPVTYYFSAGGSLLKSPGNGTGCNSTNGDDMTISDLMKVIHFGLDISGANGKSITQLLSCGNGRTTSGGQGGGGIYIIAKNVVLNGSINLNGGNGGYDVWTCTQTYSQIAGGGGSGSAVIRTNNIISNNVNFSGVGGFQTAPGNCNKRGGNGNLLILN